jgi:hypothetical protein
LVHKINGPMRTFALLPALAALSLLDPAFAFAQDPACDRKVRIEITRTENGETSRITREFDMTDEEALQEALKELGVMDELNMIGDGENVVIDLRRMKQGGMLDDMSLALSMLDDLEAPMPGQGGYLGVYYADLDGYDVNDKAKRPPVKEGCTLTEVIDDGPAANAGLRTGDVVVRLDEREVRGGNDLVEALRAHKPGDAVKVTYYRGRDKRTATVTLGPRPAEPDSWNLRMQAPDDGSMDWEALFDEEWTDDEPDAFLGITGGGTEEGVQGVRVGEVIAGSAAERMGLQEGDIIEAINGEAVNDFGALAGRVGDMEPGEAVTVRVRRGDRTLELQGNLGEQKRQRMRVMRAPMAPGMPPLAPMPFEGLEPEEREELRREMDELRREMDQLRRDLRGEVTRELRVVIQDMNLSQEESALLKGKGVANIDRALGWNDLRISPNPGDGQYRIAFTAPQRGDLTVDVHNATGERVYHETITGFKGNYERLLDLTDQPAGAYFLVIGQGNATEARKLVKQ